MDILWKIFTFILAISILVAVHEWGHFLVARFFNIKVLKFSIGFGKPLYTWQGKDETEYVLAAIPLGGYVKMLDEREGPVPEHLAERAFNRQTVLKRIAVVAAGPIFNFLFAIVAIWISLMLGVKSIIPVIGEVAKNSIAYEYGLRQNQEIKKINNETTLTWGAVNQEISKRIKNKEPLLDIEVESVESAEKLTKHITIPINKIIMPTAQGDNLVNLGFSAKIPDTPAIVGQVSEGGPADIAGFKPKDEVIKVNETPIHTWQEFVKIVKAFPEKKITVDLKRTGESDIIKTLLTPQKRIDELTQLPVGYVGLSVDVDLIPDENFRIERYGFFQGIKHAVFGTGMYIYLSFQSIKAMIVGEVSLDNLGGPIMIANMAGKFSQQGLTMFLGFLAQISIGLGVLNLLPIPLLDGGHLFYYVIELITRRPLSEKVQNFGYKIGMLFLVSLMVFAFYNDIFRIIN